MKTLILGAGKRATKVLAPNGDQQWTGEIVTLDINPDHKPNLVWDLENPHPLPFKDNEFDELHAYEVLEHIGRQGDYRTFFRQFSDYWRILKPNGVLCATCPAFGSPWMWGDPSHTRAILPETLIFLSQRSYDQVGKTAMSDFRYIYKADFEPVYREVKNGTFYFILQVIK